MMNKPASGLGRGLSALLEEAVRPTTDAPAAARPGSVREVEVARIKPNPKQPRVHFDEQAIAELAESLAERGVLQPILLRPAAEGFEIVAGERRWRAAQRARLHTIPAIVRDIDDSMAAEIALIENVQREDLNAIEEAEGYRQLIERHGHTQDEVARLVHKSRSHVANLLRLLALPEVVRNALLRGDISMGHARAIASAPDPEKLVAQVIGKGLSVRQAEDLARSAKPGADTARSTARIPAATGNADIEALERQLSDVTGLKVRVEHKGSGGKVLLHYSSLDQLDMICQRLSGEPI